MTHTKDEVLKLALEALEATTTAQNKLAASKHAEWLWLKTKGLSHKEEEELKDAYYAAEKEAAAVARRRDSLSVEAITAIKQALAARQEHEPENEPHVSLASVLEPVHQWQQKHSPYWYDGYPDNDDGGGPYETRTLYTTPPSQPAPVQEPVAWIEHHKGGDNLEWDNPGGKCTPLYTTPPAQPVVPDAMTSADIQEHIEYVAGWNDCRQAMLEMMK